MRLSRSHCREVIQHRKIWGAMSLDIYTPHLSTCVSLNSLIREPALSFLDNLMLFCRKLVVCISDGTSSAGMVTRDARDRELDSWTILYCSVLYGGKCSAIGVVLFLLSSRDDEFLLQI